MKKTLITLAALAMASVAGAYTLDGGSVDYGMIVPADYNGFYALDYTFTFKVADATDVAAEGTILGSYSGTATDAYSGNWYTLYNTGDAITLTVGRGNISTYTYGSDSGAPDTATFTNAISLDTAYLVSVTNNNGMQTVSLNSWDGAAYNFVESVTYKGNMNGSTSDYMQSTFNSTFTIPEPTTATLSLLALAGLAARRRRK